MLVFIDESGDPGFSLDKGGTPTFVIAMVLFTNPADASLTQRAIEQSGARRLHKPEFKFGKCSNDVRDAFFDCIRSAPFRIRAIAIRKDAVSSSVPKHSNESFYRYFVHQMLSRNASALRNARVIIDGSGDRLFKRNLNAELRQRIGGDAIRDIRFKDSRSDVLLQLADMCAGAIARSLRTDRADAARWRNGLAPHIDDVWEPWSTGEGAPPQPSPT